MKNSSVRFKNNHSLTIYLVLVLSNIMILLYMLRYFQIAKRFDGF